MEKPMTPEQIAQGLKALSAAFPSDQTMSNPDTVAAYVDRLRDLHPEDFSEAIRRIVDTCTFFPKIAEIKLEADAATIRRMERIEHEKRQKLLAAPKLMTVGEHQQRFKDMISGAFKFPEPDWKKRREELRKQRMDTK